MIGKLNFKPANKVYSKITDGTHDSPKKKQTGKPLITSKHIKGRNIDFETAYLISEEDFKKINIRSQVDKWDVIVSMIGEYCGYCYVERNDSIDYAVKNVGLYKTENKLEAEWLYYYLSSPLGKAYLNSVKSGSSQPYLTLGGLRKLPILIPEKEGQKIAITKILSDLDAKIALNNRINIELEAMVKLIYDYWFLQFDFPDEKGGPYRSSGGKMTYNKKLKREIPEGWAVNTLADWIENNNNGDWGESEPTGNYNVKVNCIRGADMPSLDGFKTNESPIRFIHENKEHKILLPNDLIVEISGGSPTQSTGRISYVTEETFKRYEAPLICSNFCKSVTLKNPLNMYNFYYTWKVAWEQGNMFNFEGKTSGIRNLLFSSLTESFKVPVPDPALVEKFYEFMQPIQASKQKNLLENQKLAELRDWLLPMLMNGQVKVVQTEKDTLKELFPDVNLYAEVAALQFLDKKVNGFSHGKTYIQKTMSHLKEIKLEKRLEHVEFEEYHWGMFSKTVAKSIDGNPFLYQETTPNGKKVCKVKANKMKELTKWMALPENQGFVKSIEELIALYQEPLIRNDIDRIELLNTVHRCMAKLNSDKLVDIRKEMQEWPMKENSYKNKAEKFTENETLHMIGFIKEVLKY